MEWTPSRIRQLRAQLGWNQTILSEYLDVHMVTISKWERGAMAPPSDTPSSWLDVLRNALLVHPGLGYDAKLVHKEGGPFLSRYYILGILFENDIETLRKEMGIH